ncbi:MAG: diaminopimelate decarboxylase, partial [Treponemataceae bacterium]|nr:diaminopimelate decarboxylase [Treponemataceae bacterium]
MKKTFPLTKAQLGSVSKEFKTHFYLYDEKAIRENARRLTRAFSILPDFKEHFAVKGCPNPYILKILAAEGFGGDCSSLPEVILCERAGILGEDIMFT